MRKLIRIIKLLPSCLLIFFLVFQTKSMAKETEGKNIISAKVLPSGQYPLKAKVTLKSTRGTYLDKVSLITPEEGMRNSTAKIDWKSSGSNFKYIPGKNIDYTDGDYEFNKSDDSALANGQEKNSRYLLKLPLQPKGVNTNLTLKNLRKVDIKYEDLDPENPTVVSLEIQTSDKTIIIPSTKIIKTKSAVYEDDYLQEEELELLQIHESLSMNLNKSIEKDNSYLIKRMLNLPFEPFWYFKQDQQNTVFQRRLHKNLLPIETIDLVFSEHVTKKTIRQVECNFRLTHLASSISSHILSCANLPKKIVSINDHYVLRVSLGSYVSNMFKKSKMTFLDEIIIFYPGMASELRSSPPMSKVDFQTMAHKINYERQPFVYSLAQAEFKKKTLSYLIKRELALPFDNTWRYEQDQSNAVFRKRLHFDLNSVENFEVVLNEYNRNSKYLNCRLRLGFFDDNSTSEIVECSDLLRKVKKLNGKTVMSVPLGELVLKRLSEGKKRVFLQEITIFLPGDAKSLLISGRNFFNSIRFNSPSNIQSRVDSLSTIIKENMTPKLFGVTKIPYGKNDNRRLFEVDLMQLKSYSSSKEVLKQIRVLASPKFYENKSSFHLLEASAYAEKIKTVPVFVERLDALNKRFGMGSLASNEANKVKHIQLNDFFSFQNLRKKQGVKSYQSGITRDKNFTILADDDVSHRVSNTKEGIVIDFIFYSNSSMARLILPTVGPFKTQRLLDFDWEVDGPLDVYVEKSQPLSNNTTEATLSKGLIPIIKFQAKKGVEIPQKGIFSRVHLKKVVILGEKKLRVGLGETVRKFQREFKESGIIKEISYSLRGAQKSYLHKRPLKEVTFKKVKAQKLTHANNGESDSLKNFLKPKNLIYLIKKKFDLPYDSFWHYSQSEIYTQYSRRFHEDLSSTKNIDFVLNSSYKGNPIVDCTFLITFDIKTHEIIPCSLFVKHNSSNESNLSLRSNLEEFLKINLEKKSIFLEEIDFKVYREKPSYRQNWPLTKLIFWDKDQNHLIPKKTINFPTPQWKTITNAALQTVKTIDAFHETWKENTLFYRIHKFFRNSFDSHWQVKSDTSFFHFKKRFDQDLSSLETMDLTFTTIPNNTDDPASLINPLENLACNIHIEFSDQALAPQVLDCYNLPKENVSSLDTIVRFDGREEFNSLQSSTQSDNLLIAGEKTFDQWNLPDGLVLKGKGSWIEVNWKQKLRLNSGTRFYLSIPEGMNSIESIKVYPYLENSSLPPFPYKANTSRRIRLAELKNNELDGLKLLFRFKKNKPFLFKLKEIALYDIQETKLHEAINIPTLTQGQTPLMPINLKGLRGSSFSVTPGKLKVENFVNEANSTNITWNTKVQKNINQLNSINLRYRVPKNIHSYSNCWLTLTFITSKNQVHRSFCTNELNGEIIIPAQAIFPNVSQTEERELDSIQWKIHLEKGVKHHPTLYPIDLTMHTTQKAVLSTFNDFRHSALLKIKDDLIFSPPLTNISSKNIFSASAWINLEKINHQNNKQLLSFQVLDHPYLLIKDLFIGEISHSLNVLASPNRTSLPRATTSSIWRDNSMINIIMILTIVIFGAIVVKNNFYNLSWFNIKMHMIKRVRYCRSHAFNSIPVKPYTIFIFGLLAFCAIAVLDTSGFSNPKSLIVITLLGGLYWNEVCRHFINQNNHTKEKYFSHAIPTQVHLVVALIITLVSYFLGSGAPDQNLFWIIISLFTPIYYYFPWRYRTTRLVNQFKNSYHYWAILMSTIFYLDCVALFGGLSIVHFINILTWNSLLFVISWPLLLREVQPAIEGRWPKAAHLVYDKTETQFVGGFLVALVLVAFFRSLRWEQFSEIFAIIGFFMLIVASFLKLKKLEKTY